MNSESPSSKAVSQQVVKSTIDADTSSADPKTEYVFTNESSSVELKHNVNDDLAEVREEDSFQSNSFTSSNIPKYDENSEDEETFQFFQPKPLEVSVSHAMEKDSKESKTSIKPTSSTQMGSYSREGVIAERGSSKNNGEITIIKIKEPVPIKHDNAVLFNLEKFLALLEKTAGRDKCTKILQYGAKIVGHVISLNYKLNQKWLVERVTSFEGNVSAGRKVFRFWKFMNGWVALWRLVYKMIKENYQVNLYDLIQSVQKILLSTYFMFDNLSWMAKYKIMASPSSMNQTGLSGVLKSFFNNSRATQFGLLGSKFWLYSAVFSMVSTMIKFTEVLKREIEELSVKYESIQKASKSTTPYDSSDENPISALEKSAEYIENEKKLNKTIEERRKLLRSLLALVCDFGVASALVGVWNTNKGNVGILGVVSAGLGLYDMW